MNNSGFLITVLLYVLAMAIVILGVNAAFFKGRFRQRLIADVGIALVFAAFYLIFLRQS